MKICVIMSTYNGEKYLNDQLDSIISQVFEGELIIYIRDDGSTDGTLNILSEYRTKHREVTIIINTASNVGASKSFLTALRECPDADIYAFCDQDDIWEHGKIKTAASALLNKTSPAMWISDYSVVDKNLNLIREHGMGDPCLNQFKVLFYNNVPGCVMVFNRKLLFEMRMNTLDQIRMHDVLALNVALLAGEVIYDRQMYTKYRQHDANVLGYNHKKIKIGRWVREKYKLIREKEPYDTSEYALEALRIWSSFMDEATMNEYRLIGAYRQSFIKRLKLLTRPYTKERFGRTRLSIRCKLMLGLM